MVDIKLDFYISYAKYIPNIYASLRTLKIICQALINQNHTIIKFYEQ